MKIEKERIQHLNDKESNKGHYVLYWMEQSQRAQWNHALQYSIHEANQLKIPVLVVFTFNSYFQKLYLRQVHFMLNGLKKTKKELEKQGIKLAIISCEQTEPVEELAKQAALVICDRGYLRHQVQWRKSLAKTLKCPLIQIESDVLVPIEKVSGKKEYAARTIRPKITKYLEDFIVKPVETETQKSSLDIEVNNTLDLSDIDSIIKDHKVDQSVDPVSSYFESGTEAAKSKFGDFIDNKLSKYSDNSNQPQTDDISYMSPYLHFGQISPVWLVHEVRKGNNNTAIAKYIEELVIRRELAINFVFYEKQYDQYTCIPDWAKKTLEEHASDKREYVYTLSELEQYKTHDIYWNAAMEEMVYSGFMHNYMRMYWAKKILEWTEDPEDAFTKTLYLNNKYFLDGNDPNSFVGVAWCYGIHDRPWGEFPIFGNVRTMKASGLKRKFNPEKYIEKVKNKIKST
jgi:deoxyribodipyrimidine photo-lyase